MNMQKIISENIKKLYKKTFKEEVKEIYQLPPSGSSRIYFRVKSADRSVIAAYNSDKKESSAFLYLSDVFIKNGINVPEIYAEDLKTHIYLQEDLGDETLFNRLLKVRKSNEFPEESVKLYKKVVENLAELQIKVSDKVDYSICYPRKAFDRQSIMWDLNYFKYNFLKFSDILFDEQLLEDDFNLFSEYLLKADCNFFLYRDFQSRNIMLHNDKIYFIDYQGGRKGALHYDLASQLYDAKANIPENIREEIKKHYLNRLRETYKIDVSGFDKHYYAYVLVRIMQAMGAYGYRGFFERKKHFLDSIPFAIKNLSYVLDKEEIPIEIPELRRVLKSVTDSKKLKNISGKKLTIKVSSFSYKKGIPEDKSGNGGGFVFDCRFINNPGRIEKYKELCGKDREVIDFLENLDEANNFFKSISQIVSAAVKNYQSRGFKNLAVNFGCTGGQHRSVFFAEKTAEYLKNNYDINVELEHTEGF